MHSSIKMLSFCGLLLLVGAQVMAESSLQVTVNSVEITRCDTAILTATVTGGCSPYTITWSNFSPGDEELTMTGTKISFKALDTTSVAVSVTDSSSPAQSDSTTTTVTVNPRGWHSTSRTDADTNLNFGGRPLVMGDEAGDPNVGRNVNANNTESFPLFGTEDENWAEKDITIKTIDDGGPYEGYAYPSAHSLQSERETWISNVVKNNTAWQHAQDDLAANKPAGESTEDAAGVLEAVKAHENDGPRYGTRDLDARTGGHSSLLTAAISADEGDDDPARNAEKLYAESDDELKEDLDERLSEVQATLYDKMDDPINGNYNGRLVKDWDDQTQKAVSTSEVMVR